jgi:hypothetical protein
MLRDFLLQHHTISEYLQEILMVTFLQDSLPINTAAAPAGPATPTGLYANTLVTQKYLQGGMQQQQRGMSCIVLLGLMEFMM